MLVVQVSSPSSHFAAGVHPYPIGCADDPHHLSFGQDFAASHASPLGHMLYTLDRLLLCHLQIIRRIPSHCWERDESFPISSSIIAATLVDLAPDNCPQVFVELEFDGFLLALLTLLLVAAGFLINVLGILEDFGFHLE
jgi:hypothetical protein